jgi:uncharacterized protein YkwD
VRLSPTRAQHRPTPRTRLSLPAALALAACLIIALFGMIAAFAPSRTPASSLSPSGPPGISAPAGTSLSPFPQATPSSSVLSVSPSAAATAVPTSAAASPSRSPVDRITAWENKVTELVNVERGKAGCGRLRTDARLHKAARDYSTLMAKLGFFSHTSPDGKTFVDRIAAAGYPRSAAAAENIAFGYADPAAVVKGWMGSAGHRANILNCDNKAVGVGLAYRKSTPYWTQDFGRV